MDLNNIATRYKQFGGSQIVLQYAKLGILPVVVRSFFRCLRKRQSFKAIYPEVLKRVEPVLVERFQVSRFRIQANELSHEHPNVIWWCWLQGIENAPDINRACYNSLVKGEWFMENGYKVNVIDAENWEKYIDLPDYIVNKWEKKQIPSALFSDLLRLQLLIKYGGTWIDSTVLCTLDSSFKFQGSSAQKYLEADLFLFQYTPEGTTKDISISNWFISAHSNNEVLMTLRDMLFAYWKDYDCTLDYYIFHLFFQMVAKEYPEQIAAMPYGYSLRSLTLLHHWSEPFEQRRWNKLTEKICFHKLACRMSDKAKNNKTSYYNWILNNYIH